MEEAQNIKEKQEKSNNQISEINKQKDIVTLIETTKEIKKENIDIKENIKQIINEN